MLNCPRLFIRCDRLLDKPVDGAWASDHFSVVADLIQPDHQPALMHVIPAWTFSAGTMKFVDEQVPACLIRGVEQGSAHSEAHRASRAVAGSQPLG